VRDEYEFRVQQHALALKGRGVHEMISTAISSINYGRRDDGSDSVNPLRRASRSRIDEDASFGAGPGEPDENAPLTVKELVHGLVAGYPIDREPEDHKWVIGSLLVTNFVFLVIALSVVAFAVETLPQFRDGNVAFDVIEAICVVIFTLEFVARMVTVDSQLSFWSSPLTWIDVLSIVPYYVTVGLGSDNESSNVLAALRILRLVRVVRVFKLVKNNVGFEAVFESLASSKEALSLMGFMLIVAVATFSAAIYFAELQANETTDDGTLIRPNGEVNPFQSMIHAFWWCIVTITTVGYGDDVPITGPGKAVASIAAICGIFVISFPTAILGANFADIHAQKIAERREKLKRAKMAKDRRKSIAVGLSADVAMPEVQSSSSSEQLADSRERSSSDAVVCYVTHPEGAPRDIIVTPTTAYYSPALVLLTKGGDLDNGQVEYTSSALFPAPARILTLTVVLASEHVESEVALALRSAGVSTESLVLSPRVVEVLEVNLQFPKELKGKVHLQSNTFLRPQGSVALSIICADQESETQLLSTMRTLSIDFKAHYDSPDAVSLPISRYHDGSTADGVPLPGAFSNRVASLEAD
jgi:voltage-gated potassium channel Kch